MDEQIRIEYEISQLKANTFGIEVESTKNKKEYIIDIIVPQGIIEPSIYEGEISFVIVIQGDKYPYSPPRLYCTSQFCFPHFSDGRDILSSVLQAKWSEQSKLMSIIQLLPNFIKDYFTKGDLIFFGKYYLGEKYDLKLLQRTNNELSQYAATFKVDEKAESDQILKAQQEAVSSDFSVANLDDLVMAEDFANSGIGNVMVDMPSLDDIGNF